jgi:RimJ/RimL family protein N-acetyltransferase
LNKPQKILLATQRLHLRAFSVDDAEAFFKLNADPDVMRYTGDDPFSSLEHTKTFLSNYPDYRKNGYGRWSVVLKSTGECIGWCGLKLHESGMVDIGYRFHKNQWGKGYATEAASACIDYGFHTLGLEEIVGRCAADNLASIRVLEKIGLTFWKIETCEGIKNSHYYVIRKNLSSR